MAFTHEPTLNDLIRRIPVNSLLAEKGLAELSAIQELLLVHESKMRGEGLPPLQRAHFAANYAAILSALIEERITEEFGREQLDIHRRLLDLAYEWASMKQPDPEYGELLIEGLKETAEDLRKGAEPLSAIPDSVRTPLINGHQIWVEELLVWGCHFRNLTAGDRSRLSLMLSRLQRFERYYKKDLRLTEWERESLHRRLIELNREVIKSLER